MFFEAEYDAPELDIEETEIEFVMDDDDDEPEEVAEVETQAAGAADEGAEEIAKAPQSGAFPNLAGEQQQTVDPAEIDFEVDYNETQEGSFLGIPDIDVGSEPTAQDSASQILIDDGAEAASDDIGSGDSALNDFFKGLEE